MTVERFMLNGKSVASEIIPPGTNIRLQMSFLNQTKYPHKEVYLRVDDLDQATIFFFDPKFPDYRWMLTKSSINHLVDLTYYEQGDIKISYKWRPSTAVEKQEYENIPATNIPRASFR